MCCFSLPRDVLWIIDTYRAHGFEGHVVGGPVRDLLLGTAPHDFDLTTDATPEQTKRIFHGCRLIETGISHGTVTLVLSGIPYEITTYRIDGEYLDNRHPSEITFTRSLAEDLRRRDFTVNAMAYSPYGGLVDPYGGREDLLRGVLRAVGDPYARFREDSLRILRALRFESRLGFEIEEQTSRAIADLAPLMRSLAVERVMEEWRKLLLGCYADRVIARYRAPLSVVFAELSRGLSLFSSLPTLPYTEDEEIRHFTFFSFFAYLSSLDAEAYSALCDRLHTSRALRTFGTLLLRNISSPLLSDYDLLRLLSVAGRDVARAILAIRTEEGTAAPDLCARLESLMEEGRPHCIANLAIGGHELLLAGYRGRELGRLLDRLLDAVMRGACENRADALLLYLKNKAE